MLSGSWWWVVPAVLAVGTILYASTTAGSLYAFTDWDGLHDPSFVGLDNFARAVTERLPRTALANSVILAVSFVVLANLMGLVLALALNRTLKTRYFLRVVLFMPVVLSPLAVSYVWRFIFQLDGPLNSLLDVIGLDGLQRTWLAEPRLALLAILVVMVWQHFGLTMVIYLAGLAGVPQELEEAAAIDGASAWQRFRFVTLPSIRPAVIIASTLSLILGLRVFDQVLGVTGGGPYHATETLATQVWRQAFVFSRFGYGAALSVILTVIVIAAALAQLHFMRRGEMVN
jgi:raffinose/stachyose/melibiose transport system permease protein